MLHALTFLLPELFPEKIDEFRTELMLALLRRASCLINSWCEELGYLQHSYDAGSLFWTLALGIGKGRPHGGTDETRDAPKRRGTPDASGNVLTMNRNAWCCTDVLGVAAHAYGVRIRYFSDDVTNARWYENAGGGPRWAKHFEPTVLNPDGEEVGLVLYHVDGCHFEPLKDLHGRDFHEGADDARAETDEQDRDEPILHHDKRQPDRCIASSTCCCGGPRVHARRRWVERERPVCRR
jgi:hypothetical protein